MSGLVKVLYRVVHDSERDRFDVEMRDESGRWVCVNDGLATRARADQIAAKYRAQEEGGA